MSPHPTPRTRGLCTQHPRSQRPLPVQEAAGKRCFPARTRRGGASGDPGEGSVGGSPHFQGWHRAPPGSTFQAWISGGGDSPSLTRGPVRSFTPCMFATARDAAGTGQAVSPGGRGSAEQGDVAPSRGGCGRGSSRWQEGERELSPLQRLRASAGTGSPLRDPARPQAPVRGCGFREAAPGKPCCSVQVPRRSQATQ